MPYFLSEYWESDRSAALKARTVPAYLRLPKRLRYRLHRFRSLATLFSKAEIERGVVFIHVPKNGGSTISQALFNDFKFKHKHYPAEFYRWENSELYERLTSFAVLRDPHDRLMSAYRYLKNPPQDISETTRAWIARNMIQSGSFEQFVVEWLTPGRRFTWAHLMPQAYYVTDSKGRLIVDFLLRFDRLQADFRRFAAVFVAGPVEGLGEINVSDTSKPQALSAQVRAKIYRLYAEDYALLANHSDSPS